MGPCFPPVLPGPAPNSSHPSRRHLLPLKENGQEAASHLQASTSLLSELGEESVLVLILDCKGPTLS